MKIIKRLLIFIIGLVALLAVIGLFLPAKVHVERDTWIDAPPANVFTVLNGFGRFNDWSPWAELDPDAEYSYEGPEAGVGAAMSWRGDDSVGSGSQTIVESRPYEYIEAELDFGAMGTASTNYTLKPENDGTRVTWAMDVDFGWDLMGRYMGLFFDDWVGSDYEKGLTNLKALAEGLPSADLANADIEVLTVESRPIAYVSGETTHDNEAVAAALGEAYGRVAAWLAENGLAMAGQPIAIAHEWTDNRYVFDAAIPYAEGEPTDIGDKAAPEPSDAEVVGDEGAAAVTTGEEDDGDEPAYTLSEGVQQGTTYAGRAVRAVHTGPYDSLAGTWNRVEAYMAARGLESNGDPWEVYVSDPGTTPEEELITHIFWPIE